MASLSHSQAAATIAQPVARPRAKPKPRTRSRARRRARGGILWIVVSGILLTGVVFVNVAVLRLNLSLDSTNSERSKLLAQNAALQSDYSALLSSTRIQQQAVTKLGLVYEDPGSYGYVDLAK
jgi:cell division protein FtsL